MKFDLILRVGTKLMLPFILIFAPYVHFHGDYGPGGGFQAGVIIAAAFILYAMVFGLDAAKRIAPQSAIDRLLPVGVLIFAAAGLPAIVSGQGRYLDYGVYGHDFLHAHEWGILIVETGVIVTVASTMLAIFYAFADRGRQ
jgi:multicomponent Na+:H+ antiporter subunit B